MHTFCAEPTGEYPVGFFVPSSIILPLHPQGSVYAAG